MKGHRAKPGFWSVAGRAAAAALVAFFVAGAGARSAVAQITMDSPAWKKLVAAADAEGELDLMVIPNATHRDYLAAAWPKDFPKIKLQQITLQPGTEIARIGIERSAGKYLWDVGFTGTDNAFLMRDHGMLDPFKPELMLSDVNDPKTWGGFDQVFMDKGETYVFGARHFLKMPFYNTALLSSANVKAEGTNTFLDPALRKKFVWHDPLFGGSGRTFAPVLLRLLGEGGLKQFVEDQAVFTVNMGDLIERMARSEFAVSLGPILPDLLLKYENAGIKLDVKPLGNTPPFAAYSNHGGSIMVVFNKRPHPAAAMLFINWYLSKPQAIGVAKKMGEDSARADVPQMVPPGQQIILQDVKYFDAQKEVNTPFARRAQEIIKEARKSR